MVLLLCGLLANALFSAPALASKQPPVTLFTHGDTVLLKEADDGTFDGPSLDIFRCAMAKIEHNFSIKQAPLSRARGIINSVDNAIWFPSAFQGDKDRLSRSIGPAGALQVFWFQLKDNVQDPLSPSFRDTAKVTTYQGSAMENQLRGDGFNFIDGSADRKRLLYMVLSGQVDALLAVDFRDQLSAESHQQLSDKVRMTLRNSIPVAFQVSVPLAKRNPDFVTNLRSAAAACQSEAAAD